MATGLLHLIAAERMDEFNEHVVGEIEVIAELHQQLTQD